MRRFIHLIGYPVIVLAALGVLASFSVAIASFWGHPSGKDLALRLLFPGIFIVWLPTILFANELARDFKQRDFWKASLRGCPPWMRAALWIVIALAFVAFFIPFTWGSTPGEFAPGFLLMPAVFYSVAFCTAYSFLHAEKFDAGRECLNGHRISPLAKYCEECGAPAAPKGMQGVT